MSCKIINISAKREKEQEKGEEEKKERKIRLKEVFFSYLLLKGEKKNRI